MSHRETKFTILVIEDEADILFSLSTFLESEGYFVAQARNGREALDFLSQHIMPDLILLDMKMPTMNGWEFSEQLRKQFAVHCPIVVMTAAADAEERSREVKANGWLGKPFSFEEVNSQINRFSAKP